MTTQKIKYAGLNEGVKEVMDHPVPASQLIPEWYKEIPKTSENKIAKSLNFQTVNANSCMPFFDTLVSGYLVTLHCDMYVQQSPQGAILTWNPIGGGSETFEPARQRPSERHGSYLPTPAGHDPHTFDWLIKWNFKTPKGYSCLMTHPFNRTDLPFLSATAIMDTDQWGVGGTHSFWLKSGFEGMIEAGTPIVQVLPILREEWVLEEDDSLTKESQILDIKKQTKFTGYYRDKFWKKKKYT
jgi:hypothetical protein